ncbi:hypothetical protein JIG36_28040 [Actinoplanes sp. LDG1-06]|uniref:Gram-positive cocci surface proteins LPxTG domain-containing protein n=1 Tax=Paractinoplanes ovalisporus TaxID=2810368 RepID=A0ABS2AHU2_9ACTN|nr:hypothetical protein [Actinoplanes ovalisporus]MBM2619410.1 hypothetical protein [Actinoplanes ovalisporus]
MRRLAGVALIVLIAALVPAAAAQAAPVWKLTMADVSVEPGGAAKAMRVEYSVLPYSEATRGELVVDVAAVSEIATVAPWTDPRCVTTPATITCPGSASNVSLSVIAKPGARLGATARLTVRAVVDGRTRATATGTITIAEQVSLASVETQGDVSLATGASTGLTAGVRNTGDNPVTGVVLELSTVRGFAAAPHSNCAPTEFGAACRFDLELAPGQTYRLATPWQLTATDMVWAPSQWYATFTWYTAQDYADLGRPSPAGSGPELELAPVASALADPQTETDPNNNADGFSITVTGVNQSNFTAIGATSSGKVGQTIPVRLGMRNNGPARIEGYASELGSYLQITVTPPAGTTVVKHSRLCEPFNVERPTPGAPFPPGAHEGDGNFYCFTEPFEGVPYAPGKTVNFDFTLRVDKRGTLRGSIKTERLGPPPAGDPDPSDDSAAIVITAAAPATGGGGTGGGTGGGLPITGTDTTTAALIGLALLLAGTIARVAARQR